MQYHKENRKKHPLDEDSGQVNGEEAKKRKIKDIQ
jgi:hypothetical protein